MAELRHANIVTFYGASVSDLAIVTAYVNGGDLYTILHKKQIDLHPKLRLNIAKDIAEGMYYLHNYKPGISVEVS
eukprot:gene19146-25757_t